MSPRSRLDRFVIPVSELAEERLPFLHEVDGSVQAAVGALTLHGKGVAIERDLADLHNRLRPRLRCTRAVELEHSSISPTAFAS